MTTFPLFHLPLLAMEHVLCMMNPYELLDLSLTSMKTRRTVKRFAKLKPKFMIDFIIFLGPPSITVKRGLVQEPSSAQEKWEFSWTTDQSKVGYEKNEFSVTHNIIRYSENQIEDLMRWYEYIKEVLGCQFHTVFFSLYMFPNQNRLIFEWICSHQKYFVKITIISKDKDQSEDVKYFLSNIKSCEHLRLLGSPYKDDFHVEIPEGRDVLTVRNAGFINYEQLLRLKHQNITLLKSILTNQEINRFLKSWIACESHLDLKTIQITIQSQNIMDVIMDISHEETTDLDTLIKFYYRFSINVTRGYNIYRSDEKMATVVGTKTKDGFGLFLIC
uniref:F-box domain-containing protein n=2 Tax=Caenorhabditis tropicalis TaxID=1561998 RepID=A0A1I7TUK7_9PELO